MTLFSAYSLTTLSKLLSVGGLVMLSFASPRQSLGQWREVLKGVQPDVVYFNDSGAHRTGFASGSSMHAAIGIYRTTDDGLSWSFFDETSKYTPIKDFAFKDSLIGWATNYETLLKTTDDGQTWFDLNSPLASVAVSYNRFSGRLFFNSFGGGAVLESTDEGQTWRNTGYDGSGTGFSFCDDSTGVIGAQHGTAVHFLRTTNGGVTWRSIGMDSECWQPLAIPHTKTFFALTDYGTFLRTDDAWDTWQTVYRFSPSDVDSFGAVSGCVQGDLNHLVLLLASGVYMSTDQGHSWQSLCGPSTWPRAYDHRFYAKWPLVVLPINYYDDGSVWMLDGDSLHNTGRSLITLADQTHRTSIAAGSDLAVYCRNTTTDESVALDSAHLIIHYDQAPLVPKSVSGLNSWKIISEIDLPGSIEVWLRGSGSLSTSPILSTTFATVLADTVARVYLDQPMIYSHRKNCDCAVTNNPGSDSVEIDFTGCGGPTLWHYMQTGSVFDVLSVSPNPAGGELRVDIRERGEGDVRAEVIDVLGERRLTQDLASGSSRIDLTGLESGSYFLRLSKDGEVRTRRFLVRH